MQNQMATHNQMKIKKICGYDIFEMNSLAKQYLKAVENGISESDYFFHENYNDLTDPEILLYGLPIMNQQTFNNIYLFDHKDFKNNKKFSR